MSYCRFSENSDVYMYLSATTGKIICCWCRLDSPLTEPDPALDGPQEAIAHLLRHQVGGDNVPTHAFEALTAEAHLGDPE